MTFFIGILSAFVLFLGWGLPHLVLSAMYEESSQKDSFLFLHQGHWLALWPWALPEQKYLNGVWTYCDSRLKKEQHLLLTHWFYYRHGNQIVQTPRFVLLSLLSYLRLYMGLNLVALALLYFIFINFPTLSPLYLPFSLSSVSFLLSSDLFLFSPIPQFSISWQFLIWDELIPKTICDTDTELTPKTPMKACNGIHLNNWVCKKKFRITSLRGKC